MSSTPASPTPPSLNARQPQGQTTEVGSHQNESPVHSPEPPASVGVHDTKESEKQDGRGHTQEKAPDHDHHGHEDNRQRRREHEWEQDRERGHERGREQGREKGKEREHEQRGARWYDERRRQEQMHPNDYGHAHIRGPERSRDHRFEDEYDDRGHGSRRDHSRGHRYDPLRGPRPIAHQYHASSGPSHMHAPHAESTEWRNVAGTSKHAPEVRRAPNFSRTQPPTGPRADRPPVAPRASAQPPPPTIPAPPVVATSIAPRRDAIPLKSWYCIDASPVLEADTNIDWLLRLRQWGVLSARKSKPTRHKGAAYHIFLMFKSEAKRNACREFLKNEKTRYSLTTVEDYVWEKPIQNFVGLIDVYYIDRVYAHARSDDELAQLFDVGPPTLDRGSPLGQIFLDYQQHPPVPVDRDALVPRKMDVAEFSASWYSARLASAPAGSVTVWMRRLEMMMLSHIDGMAIGNPVKSHFQEPIWRTTGGTMVADLRRIARWRQDNLRAEGSQLKTVVSKEETFGRMKGNAVWRLIVDLTLEQPWYPS
jgi:hypothetical protein